MDRNNKGDIVKTAKMVFLMRSENILMEVTKERCYDVKTWFFIPIFSDHNKAEGRLVRAVGAKTSKEIRTASRWIRNNYHCLKVNTETGKRQRFGSLQ